MTIWHFFECTVYMLSRISAGPSLISVERIKEKKEEDLKKQKQEETKQEETKQDEKPKLKVCIKEWKTWHFSFLNYHMYVATKN